MYISIVCISVGLYKVWKHRKGHLNAVGSNRAELKYTERNEMHCISRNKRGCPAFVLSKTLGSRKNYFTPIIFLTEVINILKLKWCVINFMIKIKKVLLFKTLSFFFYKKSIGYVLDDTVKFYLIRIFEIN